MPARFAMPFLVVAALAPWFFGGCSVLDPDPPNRAPVVASVTAEPAVVSPDSAAVVSVAARDPEGVPLDYRWRATAGWFDSGSTEAAAVWRAPAHTGACTLTVTVDDGRDAVVASVFVTVTPHANEPHLVLSANQRSFGRTDDRLPVRVTNEGGAEADWTAVFDADWATPAPASGHLAPTASDTLWLEADRTALPAGLHTGILTLQAGGGEAAVLGFGIVQPWTYEVVARHPHDSAAFTQGLFWHAGRLYEGTGRYGRSSLRRVVLETGAVEQQVDLEPGYFGEGIALWQDRIIQLTWLNQTAFVWDLDGFAPQGSLAYPTQGWGLTADGTRLIMSDGSANLYFRDPDTFAETGRVSVTVFGAALDRLNELEWIGGGVWANVWRTDDVVRIDPDTGEVSDIVDFSGLLTPEEAGPADVLNGIAHDPATGRTWVTGKLWPWLFEIRLVDPNDE